MPNLSAQHDTPGGNEFCSLIYTFWRNIWNVSFAFHRRLGRGGAGPPGQAGLIVAAVADRHRGNGSTFQRPAPGAGGPAAILTQKKRPRWSVLG